MKAIVYHNYGAPEVLKYEDLEKPTPKDHEVLIKVCAATVTAGDCEMRRFDLPAWIWLPIRLYMGVFRPRLKILGQELAGEIEAVGKDVKQFKTGDQVVSSTEIHVGAYAQYRCLSEKTPMAIKPANISYEEAATIPTGGFNALHFVRKAKIKSGDKVLICGAGGSIGTYALQMAKSLGAEVTCVDSGSKLNLLQSIGADHVIDYTQEDFTKKGKRYDAIIDIAGKSAYTGSIRSLNKNGHYVHGNPRVYSMLRGLWTSLISSKKVVNALAVYKTEDLHYLKDLMGKGQLKAIIDKTYPLESMVDAHRYVESGQKTGHVVITVRH